MKNILCKLGFHEPDKLRYITVHKERKLGKHRHKYHRNYEVCKRCGKRLATFSKKKRANSENTTA